MKGVKDILSGFLSRSGSYVFVASMLARLLSFTASWLVLQLVSEQALGTVIFAFSFIVFLIPIGGFGLEQSYIRYAAVSKDATEKEQLFRYTFKKGLLLAGLFSLLLAIIGYLAPFIPDSSRIYFMILSFSLLAHFILGMFQNYYRVKHQNKRFAYLVISFSVILVVLVGLLSYFYAAMGYSIALVLAPLVAVVFFIPDVILKRSRDIKPKMVNFRFWQYGFSASLANVATQLLFALDLILIGVLLSNTEAVTQYKYVSLIPFSLLFLPQVLMTTDFVKITEQIQHKKDIDQYIKNYWSLFSLISLGIGIIGFGFTKNILALFKPEYSVFVSTFRVLIIGVLGILLLRGLFGNLLSAIGKASVNLWIALVSLSVNLVSNYYFIPKYGILGAAITSASIMWLSGIVSWVLFRIFYGKGSL